MPVYGYNDWRYYQQPVLRHAWGTSPEMKSKEKAYNAKYYEEHREEILAKLKEKKRNSYDYKQAESTDDYDYWFKNHDKDSLMKVANEHSLTESMEDMDVFADADEALKNANLPPDVLENIRKNNENVRNNIATLYKTVEDYVAKNGGKLSQDDIAKMYNDAEKQANLELKRVIDVSSAEGKAYVSGGSGSKSKSSGKAKTATQIKNQQIQAANAAKLSKNQSSSNSPIDAQVKKYSGSSSGSSSSSSGGRNYGSGNSNMPTNASDLATIERERERARQRSR